MEELTLSFYTNIPICYVTSTISISQHLLAWTFCHPTFPSEIKNLPAKNYCKSNKQTNILTSKGQDSIFFMFFLWPLKIEWFESVVGHHFHKIYPSVLDINYF